MFCDVRGFTALSQKLGTDIIATMNQLFEAIGEEAEKRGGEILKFIGDAMLLIFRLDDSTHDAVSRAMLETVDSARCRIEAVSASSGHSLSVGFGCHIGNVIYGNIGTPSRLDFTVMGPAVNLASRLESLCKTVNATAVFSEAVNRHCSGLASAGTHQLKGIEESVPVWIVPS